MVVASYGRTRSPMLTGIVFGKDGAALCWLWPGPEPMRNPDEPVSSDVRRSYAPIKP